MAGSTSFPGGIDNFVLPTSANTLKNVTHSDRHQEVVLAVEAIETKVGVNSSVVTTTHDFKLSGVGSGDKAVSLTGTEVLTNKTLTSPVVNTPTFSNNAIPAAALATSAIMLGSAAASGQSGVTSVTDVSSATVTITVPAGGRSIMVMALASASSSSSAGLTSFDIQAAGSNMAGGNFRVTHNNATNSFTAMGFAIETPSAGSRTYKLRVTGVVGTSAVDATLTHLIVMAI